MSRKTQRTPSGRASGSVLSECHGFPFLVILIRGQAGYISLLPTDVDPEAARQAAVLNSREHRSPCWLALGPDDIERVDFGEEPSPCDELPAVSLAIAGKPVLPGGGEPGLELIRRWWGLGTCTKVRDLSWLPKPDGRSENPSTSTLEKGDPS